ncbi:DNA polymerase III subunit delta [Pectinatus frisingensis]|uniref:DNA polymerase III subunit delta n=1 Tax=Pectinatus frisingensis TaxID=865 RepID=UPI0018C51F38|nr:DNA polymerase III subunit delta [Pectinatus frisingensis]
MQYSEAVAELRNNNLRKLYFVAGEEKYLAEKFIRLLLKRLLPDGDDTALIKMDEQISFNDIIEACTTLPFFSKKNVVYVRNNNFLKEKKGKTAQQAERQFAELIADMPDFTVLIIETDEKPDKRRKLYKIIDKYGLVVETDIVRAYNIGGWLKGKFHEIGKAPDAEAYAYLLSTINVMQKVSLGFLDKELDKLALYTDRRDINKADLIAVLSGLPEISVFAMAEAVGEKDIKRALSLLEQQKKDGVHPLSMLAILTRHIRQLWKIKFYLMQGQSGRTIAKTVGLVPFVAEKLIKQARHFKLQVLRQAIVDFAEADYKLKTGRDNPAMLEDIMIRLCR